MHGEPCRGCLRRGYRAGSGVSTATCVSFFLWDAARCPGLSHDGSREHGSRRAGRSGPSPGDGSQSVAYGKDGLRWHAASRREVVWLAAPGTPPSLRHPQIYIKFFYNIFLHGNKLIDQNMYKIIKSSTKKQKSNSAPRCNLWGVH